MFAVAQGFINGHVLTFFSLDKMIRRPYTPIEMVYMARLYGGWLLACLVIDYIIKDPQEGITHFSAFLLVSM